MNKAINQKTTTKNENKTHILTKLINILNVSIKRNYNRQCQNYIIY